MKIALLKENKHEYRTCLVPIDIKKLIEAKHEVVVTSGVGSAIGIKDSEYLDVGAKIVGSNKEAISNSQIILKLSALTNKEINGLLPTQLVISHFNLATHPKSLRAFLKKQITSIGIESIQENGIYPLLIPNEQMKGRFGGLLGAYYLSKFNENSIGLTFAPISHNKNRAQFTILNASYAGLEAARTILALGANLTILENDEHLIKQINSDHHLSTLVNLNKSKLDVKKADFVDLSNVIAKTDVLINTNSLPSSITAKRITTKMINSMRKGSVYIDLAADQGIGADTETKPISFKKPLYVVNGVTHYVIDNIPTLYAHSVSVAISDILSNILVKHASYDSVLKMIQNDKELLSAVLTYNGNLTNRIVGEALHLEYKDIHYLVK